MRGPDHPRLMRQVTASRSEVTNRLTNNESTQPMHVADLLRQFDEGSTVISPYGLAVVTKLFDEPFKKRPEKPGDGDAWPEKADRPDMAAARIWVNGHGEETIEVDQLVPANPETMAMWNFLANDQSIAGTPFDEIPSERDA